MEFITTAEAINEIEKLHKEYNIETLKNKYNEAIKHSFF